MEAVMEEITEEVAINWNPHSTSSTSALALLVKLLIVIIPVPGAIAAHDGIDTSTEFLVTVPNLYVTVSYGPPDGGV
jgi:hypothetical protein